MRRYSRIRSAVTVAMAMFATACGTGTEPDVRPEFDAEAALEDLDALETALGSDDLSGLLALSGRTPFGSSPAAIGAVAGMRAPGLHEGGRAFARDLARRLLAVRTTEDGLAEGPIISGWHRGTTFVYDPERDNYQPDLTREGAPETGVRFVIYEVDDGGTPIVGSEIGYADLIDEGDGSVKDIVLRLVVVQHDQTVLDYRATLDHDATSGALTVDGFFSGGGGMRLDFAVALAASRVDGVGRVDLDFELGVPVRDFSIVGRVRGMDENGTGEGDVELELRRGPDRLAVEMTASEGTVDGTVLLDGEPFALVSGPVDDPVITNPTGEPLTWSEGVVLHRIVDVVEDVFDFLEDIVDPIDDLVFLGIIL